MVKSEIYIFVISLLENINLLCYFIIMDDIKLRYFIDFLCGGVIFSDFLKKVFSNGIICRVYVYMYNESIVLYILFIEFLYNVM